LVQASIPLPIIEKLHQLIIAAMKLPEVKEKFIKQGGVPSIEVDTKGYQLRMQQEYELYRKLIISIGIKPQ
jgi:hypothetical protein